MEYWNIGSPSGISLKNIRIHEISKQPLWIEKNINRGFKKFKGGRNGES